MESDAQDAAPTDALSNAEPSYNTTNQNQYQNAPAIAPAAVASSQFPTFPASDEVRKLQLLVDPPSHIYVCFRCIFFLVE